MYNSSRAPGLSGVLLLFCEGMHLKGAVSGDSVDELHTW